MSGLIPEGMFTKTYRNNEINTSNSGGRTSPLVDSTPPKDGSPSDRLIKSRFNTKWCNLLPQQIPIHNSFSFTINFDPDIDGYINCHKWQIVKLTHFFNTLKDNGTINRLVFVHEFGQKGKVHFHGILQFNNCSTKKQDRVDRFEKPVLAKFNVKKNCAHRTLQYYKIKDNQHRERQYNYMMKEDHNKLKSTYYI